MMLTLHSPQNQTNHIQKEELQANLLNEIHAKILNKIMANKSKNISERSFTMTKLASLQGCGDGSTYSQKPLDHLNRCRKSL
jgi:hypothetical protein